MIISSGDSSWEVYLSWLISVPFDGETSNYASIKLRYSTLSVDFHIKYEGRDKEMGSPNCLL